MSRQSVRSFYDSSKEYLRRLQAEKKDVPKLYQEVVNSPLFLSINRLCNEGAKILDVGCGPGFLSYCLADEGYEVTGVDFSSQFIRAAKSKWGSTSHLQFLESTVTKLPFEEELFDAVVANCTIEHIVDVEEAMQEMTKVLKLGGLIFLTFPNLLSPARPLKRFFTLRHRPKYGPETGDTVLESLKLFCRDVVLLARKYRSSEVAFDYREPDLNNADYYFEQGYGSDYDSVYLANPIDLKKYLRRSGFTILQCSSAMKQQGLLGKILERMPPVLISPVLLIARKGKNNVKVGAG